MQIDCDNTQSNHQIKQLKFELFLEVRQYHQHYIPEKAVKVFEKRWT